MVKIFPAKTDALDDLLAFCENALEGFGCSLKTIKSLCVAIEEVFVNVANYAYGDDDGDAELSIDSDDGKITIVLKDSGKPFNPLERDDPDVTLPASERKIGGLGIYITKKTMSKIFYEYKNGRNVLTMEKILP